MCKINENDYSTSFFEDGGLGTHFLRGGGRVPSNDPLHLRHRLADLVYAQGLFAGGGRYLTTKFMVSKPIRALFPEIGRK